MADELNTRITMGVSAATVMTMPVDPTLSVAGEAADAKAVGDALALKADRSEVQTAIRVNGQGADAQGLILVTGEDIDLAEGGAETVAEAVQRIDGKTAADIPAGAGQTATVADMLARTGGEIPVSDTDSTPISDALLGLLPRSDVDATLAGAGKAADAKAAGDALRALDAAAVKSVNGALPDGSGAVTVTEVQNAQQLLTDDNQVIEGAFTLRTTGGGASISDGAATLISVRGRMDHTGVVEEVLEMTVEAIPRTEPIEAALDAAAWRAAVDESCTMDFYYTTDWSADPALYGITVTGTPASGDHIRVEYVQEDRGTITPAAPQSLTATGWNLYDTQTARARVTRYSEQYGYRVGGSWTALRWTDPEGGAGQSIQPNGGLFNVPGDGFVQVTGGDATTYIYPTWSDWTGGYKGDFQLYTESVVDLSTAMAYLPWGLCAVGEAADEINLDAQQAISRIERMAYSAENIAALEAAGRAWEADTEWIYAVRLSPETHSLAINPGYTCSEHGLEYFGGAGAAPMAECLYGQNLKDKLRRDVLTISAQSLTEAQQAQARANIGAAGQLLRIYSGDAMVALPWTVEDARITENMEVVNWYVGQGMMPSSWTVTTENGRLTVTGQLLSPRTRITLWLAETRR